MDYKSNCRYLPYSLTLFWASAKRKQKKSRENEQNTKILEVRHFVWYENGRQRLLGAQSINSEIVFFSRSEFLIESEAGSAEFLSVVARAAQADERITIRGYIYYILFSLFSTWPALFYGAIFGNLTAIIQRLYSKTAPYRQELRVIKDFTEYHEVPASLQKMLQCYITHEQASAAEDEIKTVRTRSLSRDALLKWIWHFFQQIFVYTWRHVEMVWHFFQQIFVFTWRHVEMDWHFFQQICVQNVELFQHCWMMLGVVHEFDSVKHSHSIHSTFLSFSWMPTL